MFISWRIKNIGVLKIRRQLIISSSIKSINITLSIQNPNAFKSKQEHFTNYGLFNNS